MPAQSRELIEWKPEYSVNVECIDKQHQALISIISHLQEAMLEGKTKKILAPLFASMNQYTKYHFAYEEQLMEQNGYPGFAAHQRAHAALIPELKELEKKYLQGSLTAGAPLMHSFETGC